jgi:hypothetical protein
MTAALAALSALPASAFAAEECDRVASPGADNAQRLLDSLRPGEIGCLHGGAYESTWDNVLHPRRGGGPGAPVTLRSYPGERARLVGIIDIPHGADYVTLSGLDIEGTGEDGANTIKVYARGFVLERSDVTNAWRGRSCLILGNNEGGGQAVAPQRTRVAHNVIDGSGRSMRGGIVFGGDGRFASGGNLVERNVIAYAASGAITSWWEGPVGTGNLARDNCVWGSRGLNITHEWGFTAVANRVAKPLFANRGARDYRLMPGSPCLRTVGDDRRVRRSRVRRKVARRARVEFRLRGVKAGQVRSKRIRFRAP